MTNYPKSPHSSKPETFTLPEQEAVRDAIREYREWQTNSESVPDYNMLEIMVCELERLMGDAEQSSQSFHVVETQAASGYTAGLSAAVRECETLRRPFGTSPSSESAAIYRGLSMAINSIQELLDSSQEGKQ